MSSLVVLVPLQLDAFVLHEGCCDPKNSFRICPITQPNYTFLRLTDSLLTADILDHVDLHDTQPASLNNRLTDVGTNTRHQNRVGVYLKWTLPPVYRSGAAVADAKTETDFDSHMTSNAQKGYPPSTLQYTDSDLTTPQMRSFPNRWLIVRQLHMDSISPANASIPATQAWIIESDRKNNINALGLDYDLETDVTPFVDYQSTKSSDPGLIENQAEIFIGQKFDYDSWNPSDPKASYIDLNVLTSSNPLFADYQPHNSNVLSFVDDFSYTVGNQKSYLSQAKADYQIIGWHSDPAHDPFTTDTSRKGVLVPVLSQRLSDCQMRLKGLTVANPDKDTVKSIPFIEDPKFGTDWLNFVGQNRGLCHATMYNVQYTRQTTELSKPMSCPANDAAVKLTESQPVAIGVSPFDALLAYCRVHESQESDKTLSQMEQDLERIQLLLNATEGDDVDALQAAKDESYEQAFQHFDSETYWHFQQTDRTTNNPVIPTDAQKLQLRNLNSLQRALDVTSRTLQDLKWELFAQWWNFVSGLVAKTTDQRTTFTSTLANLKSQITSIKTSWSQLQGERNKQLKAFGTDPPQKATSNRYYQRKDPTLLLGNIQSGWDPTFSDLLPIRVHGQEVTSGSSSFASFVSKLPPALTEAAKAILDEFGTLGKSNSPTLSHKQTIPWFHAESSIGRDSRDIWNGTQPWQPLFVEWEAVYTHIPWEQWKFSKSGSHSDWGSKQYRYIVSSDASTDGGKDTRTVSGRIIILPQVSSTLKNTLQQVFSTTNPDILATDYKLPPAEQQVLLNNASELQFVSSPMTGLTSNLLTLHEGSHFKPAVTLPGSKPLPIEGAYLGDPKLVGFTSKDMTDMLTSRATTPYGATAVDTATAPMKLVTHGQLMFTKLNVIDKFGQAICAIDPSPRHRKDPIPTISPCLGDTYFPSVIGGDESASVSGGRPNVVLKPTDIALDATDQKAGQDQSPFIQLTPAINQPARINGVFCVKDGFNFRPCLEWENPIWGWLVVNYADYGLQIFLEDGTFYREVRVGGPTGNSAGLKWLPFDPPPPVNPNDPNQAKSIKQLDFLIAQLVAPATAGQPSYLTSFVDMINASIEQNQAHPPDAFASFASSIVGKPLALVNIGYSLELANAENKNWSLVNPQVPTQRLLPDTPTQPSYSFPVKLGDVERTFDGLVGYFKASKPNNLTSGPPPTAPPTSDFDLSNLYTYFANPASKTKAPDPRRLMDDGKNQHFETLAPYWAGNLSLSTDTTTWPQTIAKFHNDQLQVFGAICDPFLPIHAYSGILPNLELKLPSWTVESAMKNMTAFFHAGPLIVTHDVAAVYNAKAPLDATYNAIINSPPVPGAAPLPVVGLPLAKPMASTSGADASWKWLQPYLVPDGQDPKAAPATRFNAMDISDDSAAGADAREIRLDQGPYTAVEGFVQLAKGIVNQV